MEKRVLVAEVPQFEPRLAAVMGGYRPLFVHTIRDALKALAEHEFALVLIGMHFDDSRMFDLLREVRAGGRNREVPVLCYRLRPLAFSALGTEALEAAVEALGGRAFVDLSAQEQRSADRALGELIASLTGSG
jgi:DNA-binding NtrC family response regulator